MAGPQTFPQTSQTGKSLGWIESRVVTRADGVLVTNEIEIHRTLPPAVFIPEVYFSFHPGVGLQCMIDTCRDRSRENGQAWQALALKFEITTPLIDIGLRINIEWFCNDK